VRDLEPRERLGDHADHAPPRRVPLSASTPIRPTRPPVDDRAAARGELRAELGRRVAVGSREPTLDPREHADGAQRAQRRGATRSAASCEVMTGCTSKSAKSLQHAIHCSRSAGRRSPSADSSGAARGRPSSRRSEPVGQHAARSREAAVHRNRIAVAEVLDYHVRSLRRQPSRWRGLVERTRKRRSTAWRAATSSRPAMRSMRTPVPAQRDVDRDVLDPHAGDAELRDRLMRGLGGAITFCQVPRGAFGSTAMPSSAADSSLIEDRAGVAGGRAARGPCRCRAAAARAARFSRPASHDRLAGATARAADCTTAGRRSAPTGVGSRSPLRTGEELAAQHA